MELSPLTVMLLLAGFIHSTQTQPKDGSERPKPVVNIKPDNQVFKGEPVTLTCNIQGGGNTEWTYSWKKDNNPVDKYSGKQEFSISMVRESDRGVYSCRGQTRDNQYTEISDGVRLTVSDHPKPTVSVNPQSFIYTGDTVTLTCEMKPSTGWKFIWYRNVQNSVIPEAEDSSTLSIKASNAESRIYSCMAQRGIYTSLNSDTVTITVRERPKPTVKVPPADHVFTGEKVTLTCQIEAAGSWQYEWYRNNEKLRGVNVQKNEYIISSISESDEGDYTCKGTQSTRPTSSEISAAVRLTVSDSVFGFVGAGGFVGIAVGLILILFFTIMLILLWRYKKNKGSGSRSPTLNPNTNQAADADHVYEPVGVEFNRKTDDSAACSSAVMPAQVLTEEHEANNGAVGGSSDVTYSQIELKNLKRPGKGDSTVRPNDVVYSQINTKSKKPTGAAAKPDDVTYSELNLKPSTKPKRKGGKSSVGADTVYSELKNNTDKGDSEPADSTYAQVMKRGNKKY